MQRLSNSPSRYFANVLLFSVFFIQIRCIGQKVGCFLEFSFNRSKSRLKILFSFFSFIYYLYFLFCKSKRSEALLGSNFARDKIYEHLMRVIKSVFKGHSFFIIRSDVSLCLKKNLFIVLSLTP